MVWTTLLFGVLLALLGAIGYWVAEPAFWPVAVPAALGLLLIVAGLTALKPSFRRNAMHAAVFIALLGVVGTARAMKELIALVLDKPGLIVESVTTILCGVFLLLAAKSFIDARRRPAGANSSASAADQANGTESAVNAASSNE